MAIDKAGMTKLAYSRSYQQIAQSNHGSRNYIDSLDMNKPTVTDNSIGVRYETDKEGQLTLTDESEELIYDRLDRVLQGEISSTTIYSPVIIPGSPTNIGNESSLKLRSRKLLQDLGVLDKYSPEELNQLKGKVAVDISAII